MRVKAIISKEELRNHMEAKRDAKEETGGTAMNENLKVISDLIDMMDLSLVPSNVLQMLACMTLHIAYLEATIESQKELYKEIRKIQDKVPVN